MQRPGRCDRPGEAIGLAAGSQPTGNWTAETACTSATGAPGNLVSVHVRFTFRAITPIVGQVIGGTVQRDAFATMAIN